MNADRITGLVEHPLPNAYPIGPDTIAECLADGAHAYSTRVALVDGERSWTFSELHDTVNQTAANIARGQVIVWTEPNSAELVVAMLATFVAGGIWAGDLGNAAQHHAESLELLTRPKGSPFEAAMVTFTSGTTGTPKAVVHSEHSLLGPGLLSIEAERPHFGERIGTPLDLRIGNMAILGPISALLRGSTFVVMHRRFAPHLAEDIEAFGVTRLFAVPTLAFDLAESADVSPKQLASIDRVILGGAGAKPSIITAFRERFGVRPTLSYGLSEAPTGIVRESTNDPVGSGRGFPLPHIEIVIVDPKSGVHLPDLSVGEICVREASDGDWAGCWTGTLGYLGEPDRTDRLFANGLLHTGDLGRLDIDGALSVTGRLNDLIVRGGKNIDPIAIESQLAEREEIVEALVVGVPDDRLGERVGLLVVLNTGLWPDTADSLDLVELVMDVQESGIGPLDMGKVVHELPRNEMGKLQRNLPASTFGPGDQLDS